MYDRNSILIIRNNRKFMGRGELSMCGDGYYMSRDYMIEVIETLIGSEEARARHIEQMSDEQLEQLMCDLRAAMDRDLSMMGDLFNDVEIDSIF